MVEGVSDGGFNNDDSGQLRPLSIADVLGQSSPQESDSTHSFAQQVAPGFFRGPGGTPAVPADALPRGGVPPAVPVNPNPVGGNGFFGGQVAQLPPGAGPDVTQRDWRAHPFVQPVAPGFFRQNVIPPNQRRQGFDAAPPPPAVAQAGRGGRSMQDQVAALNPLVERSLDKKSGFIGNEILGGFSSVAAGGPLARALDWGTKKYLASGEPHPSGQLGPVGGFAAWWQRNHGLTIHEDLLAPLFTKDGELSTQFRNRLPNLDTAIKTMEAKAEALKLSGMSEADLAVMSRARLLQGQALPRGVRYELPQSDVDMLLKQRELLERIDLAAAELSNMPKFDKAELVSHHALLDTEIKKYTSDARIMGEPAALKVEAELKLKMSPAELDTARKYKFFTDFQAQMEKNPLGTGVKLDPADYRITLSAAEEDLLKTLKTPKELGSFISSHLEPAGKPALERMAELTEKCLSRDELLQMRRYEFWQAYGKNAELTPSQFGAQLETEQAVNVDRFRRVSKNLEEAHTYDLKKIDLDGLGGELRTVEARYNSLLNRLKKDAEPFEARLKQTPESMMSQADLKAYKALKDKYEFFEKGAVGNPPPGVVLNAEEAELFAKRQGYRQRIELLNPWASPMRSKLLAEREVLGSQMAKLADGMTKDIGEIMIKVESRPVTTQLVHGVPVLAQSPVESVLSAQELSLWNKYKYLKSGGKTALPAAEALTSQEAQLVVRVAELEKGLASAAGSDAVAANGFRAMRNLKGEKIAEGHIGNFFKGMAAIAAADFISDRIDNHLWGPSHRGSTPYVTAVTPWVGMMVPGKWYVKGGAIVGLNVLGGAVEHMFPIDATSNPQWNRILRPNGVDAIALGLATTIPMRNESIAGRLAYMGIAWGGAKVARYFLEGPSAREIRDKSWDLFAKDKTERSEQSMARTIDELKKLDTTQLQGDAKQWPTVLNYYLEDWMVKVKAANKKLEFFTAYQQDSTKKPQDFGVSLSAEETEKMKNPQQLQQMVDFLTRDAINRDRGLAIFLTASGEGRLEKGTSVPKGRGGEDNTDSWWWKMTKQTGRMLYNTVVTGPDQQFDYIVAGKDYDLGGQALRFLASAKVEFGRAKQQTNAFTGQQLRGTTVQASEVADLSRQEARVDASLSKIYGKHDIPALYKEVQEYTIKLNQDVMKKMRDDIKNVIRNPNTDDKAFIAKFYRDLALIDLAWAGNKIGDNGVGSGKDGETALRLLGEAKLALAKARELDPDPKKEDLIQLEAIKNSLEGKVGRAVEAQWADNLFNPLNTPRNPQVPRPAPNLDYKFGVNK